MKTILITASISAFILTYIFSYIMIHIAERYSLYDVPDGRKLHKHPVPTLGGLSFIATFYIMIGGGFIIYPDFVSQILSHNLTALVVSQLLIVGVGIYDDIRGLSAPVKFSVQIISSLSLSLASFYQGQDGVAVLFMILAFSMLAFLKFNFYKAKIFMGNTGSLFLGFTVAPLSLLISRKT